MIRSFPLLVLGSGLSFVGPFEPLHNTGEAGPAKAKVLYHFKKFMNTMSSKY